MKLIIFDVYGTLISTGTGSLDAVKKFCHYKTKILIRKNFIKQVVGMGKFPIIKYVKF